MTDIGFNLQQLDHKSMNDRFLEAVRAASNAPVQMGQLPTSFLEMQPWKAKADEFYRASKFDHAYEAYSQAIEKHPSALLYCDRAACLNSLERCV